MTAKEQIALLANIKFGRFYHEHMFFMEDGAQPLPSHWTVALEALNRCDDPADPNDALVAGWPVFRVLAFRWLGRTRDLDSVATYHSLN